MVKVGWHISGIVRCAMRHAFAYALFVCLALLLIRPAAAQNGELVDFVTAHRAILKVQTAQVAPGGVARISLSDPLFAHPGVESTPVVFVAGHPIAQLLAGVDALLALNPKRLASTSITHPTLGRVTQIETEESGAVKLWVAPSGVVYWGDSQQASFLTQLTPAYARTGQRAEISLTATYLQSLKLKASKPEPSTFAITVATPLELLSSEPLRDVMIAVRTTAKSVPGSSDSTPTLTTFSTSMARIQWIGTPTPITSGAPTGYAIESGQRTSSAAPSSSENRPSNVMPPLEDAVRIQALQNTATTLTPTPTPTIPPTPTPTPLDFTRQDCATTSVSQVRGFTVSAAEPLELEIPDTVPTGTATPVVTGTATAGAVSTVVSELRSRGAILPRSLIAQADVVPYLFRSGEYSLSLPTDLKQDERLVILWVDSKRLEGVYTSRAGVRMGSFSAPVTITGGTGGTYDVSPGSAVRALTTFVVRPAVQPPSAGGQVSGGSPTSQALRIENTEVTVYQLMTALGDRFEVVGPVGCGRAVRHERFSDELTKLLRDQLKPALTRVNRCYGTSGTGSTSECACRSQLSLVESAVDVPYVPGAAAAVESGFNTYSGDVAVKLSNLTSCLESSHPQLNVHELGLGDVLDSLTGRDASKVPAFARECVDVRRAAFEGDPARFGNLNWNMSEADFLERNRFTSEEIEELRRKCICKRGARIIQNSLRAARGLSLVKSSLERGMTDSGDPDREVLSDLHAKVSTDLDKVTTDSVVRDIYIELWRNRCWKPLQCGERDEEAEQEALQKVRERLRGYYLAHVPEPKRSELLARIEQWYARRSNQEKQRDRSADDMIRRKLCDPALVEPQGPRCATFGRQFAGSLLSYSGVGMDPGDPSDNGLDDQAWKPPLKSPQVNWLDAHYRDHLCEQPPKCENRESAIFDKPREWLLHEDAVKALKDLFVVAVQIPRKVLSYKTVVTWVQNFRESRKIEKIAHDSMGRPIIQEDIESYFKGQFKYHEPLCNVASCDDKVSNSLVKSVVTREGKTVVKTQKGDQEVETLGFVIVDPEQSKRVYFGGGRYELQSQFCRQPFPQCYDSISGEFDKGYFEGGQSEDWRDKTWGDGGNKWLRYSLWHYPRNICMQQQSCPGGSGQIKWRYSKRWECRLEPNYRPELYIGDVAPGAFEKLSHVLVCRAQLEDMCPDGTPIVSSASSSVSEEYSSSESYSTSESYDYTSDSYGSDVSSGGALSSDDLYTSSGANTSEGLASTPSSPGENSSSSADPWALTKILSLNSAWADASGGLGVRGLSMVPVPGTKLYDLTKVFYAQETKVYDGQTLLIRKDNHLPVHNDVQDDRDGDGIPDVNDGALPAPVPVATYGPNPHPSAIPSPSTGVSDTPQPSSVIGSIRERLVSVGRKLGSIFSVAWRMLKELAGEQYDGRFTGVTVGDVALGMLEFEKLWKEATLEAQSLVDADDRYRDQGDPFKNGPREKRLNELATARFKEKWEASTLDNRVKAIVTAKVHEVSEEIAAEEYARQEKNLTDSGALSKIEQFGKKLTYYHSLGILAEIGFIDVEGESPHVRQRRAEAIRLLEEHGDIIGWKEMLYFTNPPSWKRTPILRDSSRYHFNNQDGKLVLNTAELRREADALHDEFAQVSAPLREMVYSGDIDYSTYHALTAPLYEGYLAVNTFVETQKVSEAMDESMAQIKAAFALEVGLSALPVGRIAKWVAAVVKSGGSFFGGAIKGAEGGTGVVGAVRLYGAVASAKAAALAERSSAFRAIVSLGRNTISLGKRIGRVGSWVVNRAANGGSYAAIVGHYFKNGVRMTGTAIDAAFLDNSDQAFMNHAYEMTTTVDPKTGEVRQIDGMSDAMRLSLSESLESGMYGGISALGRYGPGFSAFLATYNNMKPEINNLLFGKPITSVSEFRQGLETVLTHFTNAQAAYYQGNKQEVARQLGHMGLQGALMGEDFLDTISGARSAVTQSRPSGVAQQTVTSEIFSRANQLGRGLITPRSSLQLRSHGVVEPFDVAAVGSRVSQEMVRAQETHLNEVARSLGTVGIQVGTEFLPAEDSLSSSLSRAALTLSPSPQRGGSATTPLHNAIRQVSESWSSSAPAAGPIRFRYDPISGGLGAQGAGFNPVTNTVHLSRGLSSVGPVGLVPIRDLRVLQQVKEVSEIRTGRLTSLLVGGVQYRDPASGNTITHDLGDVNLYTSQALGNLGQALEFQQEAPAAAVQFLGLAQVYGGKARQVAGALVREIDNHPITKVELTSSSFYSGVGNPTAKVMTVTLGSGATLSVPLVSQRDQRGLANFDPARSAAENANVLVRNIVQSLRAAAPEFDQAYGRALGVVDFSHLVENLGDDGLLLEPSLLPPSGNNNPFSLVQLSKLVDRSAESDPVNVVAPEFNTIQLYDQVSLLAASARVAEERGDSETAARDSAEFNAKYQELLREAASQGVDVLNTGLPLEYSTHGIGRRVGAFFASVRDSLKQIRDRVTERVWRKEREAEERARLRAGADELLSRVAGTVTLSASQRQAISDVIEARVAGRPFDISSPAWSVLGQALRGTDLLRDLHGFLSVDMDQWRYGEGIESQRAALQEISRELLNIKNDEKVFQGSNTRELALLKNELDLALGVKSVNEGLVSLPSVVSGEEGRRWQELMRRLDADLRQLGANPETASSDEVSALLDRMGVDLDALYQKYDSEVRLLRTTVSRLAAQPPASVEQYVADLKRRIDALTAQDYWSQTSVHERLSSNATRLRDLLARAGLQSEIVYEPNDRFPKLKILSAPASSGLSRLLGLVGNPDSPTQLLIDFDLRGNYGEFRPWTGNLYLSLNVLTENQGDKLLLSTANHEYRHYITAKHLKNRIPDPWLGTVVYGSADQGAEALGARVPGGYHKGFYLDEVVAWSESLRSEAQTRYHGLERGIEVQERFLAVVTQYADKISPRLVDIGLAHFHEGDDGLVTFVTDLGDGGRLHIPLVTVRPTDSLEQKKAALERHAFNLQSALSRERIKFLRLTLKLGQEKVDYLRSVVTAAEAAAAPVLPETSPSRPPAAPSDRRPSVVKDPLPNSPASPQGRPPEALGAAPAFNPSRADAARQSQVRDLFAATFPGKTLSASQIEALNRADTVGRAADSSLSLSGRREEQVRILEQAFPQQEYGDFSQRLIDTGLVAQGPVERLADAGGAPARDLAGLTPREAEQLLAKQAIAGDDGVFAFWDAQNRRVVVAQTIQELIQNARQGLELVGVASKSRLRSAHSSNAVESSDALWSLRTMAGDAAVQQHGQQLVALVSASPPGTTQGIGGTLAETFVKMPAYLQLAAKDKLVFLVAPPGSTDISSIGGAPGSAGMFFGRNLIFMTPGAGKFTLMEEIVHAIDHHFKFIANNERFRGPIYERFKELLNERHLPFYSVILGKNVLGYGSVQAVSRGEQNKIYEDDICNEMLADMQVMATYTAEDVQALQDKLRGGPSPRYTQRMNEWLSQISRDSPLWRGVMSAKSADDLLSAVFGPAAVAVSNEFTATVTRDIRLHAGPGLAYTHRSPEERLRSLSPAEREELVTNMRLSDADRGAKIAVSLGLLRDDPKIERLLELHRDPRYPGTLEASTLQLQNKIDDAMEILVPGYRDMTPEQRRVAPAQRRKVADLVRMGVLGVPKLTIDEVARGEDLGHIKSWEELPSTPFDGKDMFRDSPPPVDKRLLGPEKPAGVAIVLSPPQRGPKTKEDYDTKGPGAMLDKQDCEIQLADKGHQDAVRNFVVEKVGAVGSNNPPSILFYGHNYKDQSFGFNYRFDIKFSGKYTYTALRPIGADGKPVTMDWVVRYNPDSGVIELNPDLVLIDKSVYRDAINGTSTSYHFEGAILVDGSGRQIGDSHFLPIEIISE